MLARNTVATFSKAASRRVARTSAFSKSAIRTLSSDQAPTSFSHEKMEADARYKTTMDIPEALLQSSPEDSPFSIQGQFREGRAAYLDMSATTPLDPRVLDAMAPYMVRKDLLSHQSKDILNRVSSISLVFSFVNFLSSDSPMMR